MPADTIREALLEAKAALRRKADDENTQLSQAKLLREAGLLAEIHANALDPRGGGNKDAVCALAGVATPHDFATMALLLCDTHTQGAANPEQPKHIVEGLQHRAAVWGLLAEEFPRPTDEGVGSVMLWAYMARINLAIIGMIQHAPPQHQIMLIREVNMLGTENLQLAMMNFHDATTTDGESAPATESKPTSNLIQVVSG